MFEKAIAGLLVTVIVVPEILAIFKTKLIKIWNVLTYKWQLQILFNLPFLVWWLLDISILKVHQFDLWLLSYLNLPEWVLSLIGFGQSSL